MFRRFLTGVVFTGFLTFSAVAADVIIRVAPPRRLSERRDRAPSRNHVWISGYQRWQGNSYQWTPGRWEQRPTPRARYVAPRYVRRGGGYVFVDGRWR
jgi:hypothetical protein